MAVKNDLKKLRKEQRLKQADLAIAVGMCENSISNIELKKNPASHETVVFIPGRKYRSKTTGIDRLESVARMHEGQYRMPALLHVPKG